MLRCDPPGMKIYDNRYNRVKFVFFGFFKFIISRQIFIFF